MKLYFLHIGLQLARNPLKSMDFSGSVQGVPGEVMGFSNTHPIPSSVVNIDLTLALPSFFVFFYRLQFQCSDLK